MPYQTKYRARLAAEADLRVALSKTVTRIESLAMRYQVPIPLINASQRIDNRPEHAVNKYTFCFVVCVFYGGISTWCIYVVRGTLQEIVWKPLRLIISSYANRFGVVPLWSIYEDVKTTISNHYSGLVI